MAKYTVTIDTEDGSFEVSKNGFLVSDKIKNVSLGVYNDDEDYPYSYFSYTIIDSNGDEVSRRVMVKEGKCTCNNVSASLIREAGAKICGNEKRL